MAKEKENFNEQIMFDYIALDRTVLDFRFRITSTQEDDYRVGVFVEHIYKNLYKAEFLPVIGEPEGLPYDPHNHFDIERELSMKPYIVYKFYENDLSELESVKQVILEQVRQTLHIQQAEFKIKLSQEENDIIRDVKLCKRRK